jgi:hypothetical protein
MKILVDGELFEGATAEYVLRFYRRWEPEKKIEEIPERGVENGRWELVRRFTVAYQQRTT